MVKKTKKPKENGEEEATKETDNKEGTKTENKNESGETTEDKTEEDAVKESEEDDVSYRTPSVVNMPQGQKPLGRLETVGARQAAGSSATTPEQESPQSMKNEKRVAGTEAVKGLSESLISLLEITFSSYGVCSRPPYWSSETIK